MPNNDDSRISEAAYHLWVKDGRPEGQDMDHWLRARADLEAAQAPTPEKNRAATKPKAKASAKPKAAAKPRKSTKS